MITLGCLSLGSRLKRLSDRMYKDVASIYQQQGVELNPTYFPLFNLLHQHGPLSVTQAAEILNVSHPAISKIAVKMQREELLYKTPDPDDERRYFLALDKKSLQLLTKIDPILREMRSQLDTIINTQQHPILDSLTEFENIYEQTGLVKPVLNTLAKQAQPTHITLLSWLAQYKADFHRLNYAWLEKYFNAELNQLDRQALDTPESYYLARGGYIWFAKLDNTVVGCIALANHKNGRYEISKMAVDEQYQGYGIGRKLLLVALDKAREVNANSVYLESSSLLTNALTLYRNMGFSEIEHPEGKSHYKRSDIYMELTI